MQRDIDLEATIVAKYAVVSPVLDERSRRLWAATESMAIGYGGDILVSDATGLARKTIRNPDNEKHEEVQTHHRQQLAAIGLALERLHRASPGSSSAIGHELA